MSVLKEFRRTSKTEYVDNAIRIFEDSLSMVTRLSARYERVLGQFVMEIANQLVQHVEEGNSIRITDQVTYDLRERHLVEAKALVRALDVDLRIVCDILGENPQGAYKTSNNQPVSSDKAKKRLGYLIDNTGSNIDKEIALIDGVLASDKKIWNKKMGIKDEDKDSEAKTADEFKKEDSNEVLLEEPEGAQKAREQLFEISQNCESNQISEVEDVFQNTSGENDSDESESSELSCESGSDNTSYVKIECDDSDDEQRSMIQANEVLETAKAACNSTKSKSDSSSTTSKETLKPYDPKKTKPCQPKKDSIDDLPDYHIEPKKTIKLET